MSLRIAFVRGWSKDHTLAAWKSWIDSMQYATAELSKKHSVRVFVVRKKPPSRQIINGIDFTFCKIETVMLLNHLKQFNPHMIFLNQLNDPKWPAIIRVFPKTWKGIIDHGDPKLRAPLPQKLDAIIVQREYQRKIAASANNIPLKKVLLCPYGVKDIFQPLPIQKTHTGIMVADFRSNIKRQGLLIRAWEKIPGKLILIGYFNRSHPRGYHLKCMKLTKTLGIANRVDFIDGVPKHELPAIINKAKIAYMTSAREAGPRALPEMMACGLPAIVLSDCLATTHGVRHKIDGWIAQPTTQGIKDATMKVLKNWHKMGATASERIRRQYPYDQMLNFYRDLIRSV